MKIYLIIGWTAISFCFFDGSVLAQKSHFEHGKHSTPWSRDCVALEDFELSEDQLAAVSRIDEQYKSQVIESY